MRLIFLCGCLDPGNGVGDYTRRLAKGLSNFGHEIRIIAINEKNLPELEMDSIQNHEPNSIFTHRFSNKISWKLRKARIIEIISRFNPDVISIQFVPFSFHPKGLPFSLPSWLLSLDNGKINWHLMFHELWVADSKANSLKEWIIREMQKRIIKKILFQFKNAWIDTSNKTYQNMLMRYNIKAGLLPIFSNLPKGNRIKLPQISNRDNKILSVFFGHLQENPNFLENIKLLKNAIAGQLSKELVIFHIGNNRNSKTEKLIKQISGQLEVQTIPMGFLDEQQAANVLYNVDIGLSNYPGDLIQKSGSISSMLYNELPVILLNGDNSSSAMSNLPEITHLNEDLDFNLFIYQNTAFWRKYDPFLTAKNLDQRFVSN